MIADVHNLKFLGSTLQTFDKDNMYKTTWFNEEDGTTVDLYIPVTSDVAKEISKLQFGQTPKIVRLRFKRRNGEKGWFPSVAYISIN